MYLNDISPAEGSKTSKKRLGRGHSSGLGKTSGKGHKGQHARAGGLKKVNFEGGQMPLQRRLPKFGFRSHKNREVFELPSFHLDRFEGAVDFQAIKDARLVPSYAKGVRFYLKGELTRAVSIKKSNQIHLTAGVAKAILAQGGQVEA